MNRAHDPWPRIVTTSRDHESDQQVGSTSPGPVRVHGLGSRTGAMTQHHGVGSQTGPTVGTMCRDHGSKTSNRDHESGPRVGATIQSQTSASRFGTKSHDWERRLRRGAMRVVTTTRGRESGPRVRPTDRDLVCGTRKRDPACGTTSPDNGSQS